jgi:hypothetical protein
MNIMPIDGIDDYEMRLKRQDAFWDCEVLDRACVNLKFAKKTASRPVPVSRHATLEARWMDVDFQVEKALAATDACICMGDALPTIFPTLGPDFFPALYGGEIIFEDTTSYIKPFLEDWADADQLVLSREHSYWKKMEELYDAFLVAGKNKFYTGWPDLHPGADGLVGLRGPQALAIDLFDEPDAVKMLLKKVTADYFEVYDHYYTKLSAARQACTGWPGMVSTRKWSVPSNDFSYMISPAQFNEFFLEGLREECDFFEANIHHLDGVGCLNHLDSLLEIKSLNAIQWVWGAGKGEVTDWLDVFKKIQAAGKGIQLLSVEPKHLDRLMENLRPEGVWMHLVGVTSIEEGDALLKKISQWV